MSQASKHVEWCIHKAKKEIEEVKENSVIDLREDYTYGVQISVKDEAKINDLKKTCKELVDITKEIIFK